MLHIAFLFFELVYILHNGDGDGDDDDDDNNDNDGDNGGDD